MKSREGIVRLKRFQVEEKRRQVSQIQIMIAEFEKISVDLEKQIAFEEEKAGITDKEHFAYPTFAKAAELRRVNLEVSTNELRGKLDAANDELQDALEDLQAAEKREARDGGAIDEGADFASAKNQSQFMIG
jgi:hypothetical protein